MTNPKTHYVLYVGDGVVQIPGVGVFQRGTGAWVDAATAEIARGQGEFQVTDPQGGVEPASAPVAPVEQIAAPEPEPEPEPAKPEEPPAPVAEAAPPQKRPRRGRASAMMSAVVVEDEAAAAPPSETEPKKE